MADTPQTPRIGFGVFELDLEAGELRKSGVRIKLQEQPFQVLAALLEQPGAVVTRTQLCQRLWPDGTFVDFDTSLSVAVTKIRQVLGDSADNPHFVETVPRRGYRFIYPLEGEGEAAPGSGAERETPAAPASRRRRMILWALAGLAVLAAVHFGWRAWRAVAPEGSASAAVQSLAVLPLQNLSDDREQEYFSDGMTDALISDLGTIGALRVISRTSVMNFKGSNKPLPEIARELNASHIVEGSVLRAGEQVRITTRLIDAANDRQIWSQSYERPLKDVLSLQSDVAQAIARAVKINLKSEERTRLAGRRAVNPEAQDAFFRGRFHISQGSPDGIRKGIDYYKKAIEIDPGYAPAYAGLADAYMRVAWGDGAPPKEAMAQAKAAILRAMQLDDTLDSVVAIHGAYSLNAWDWPQAKGSLERALALNPSGPGRHSHAYYLINVEGDLDGALADANLEMERDPMRLQTHVLPAILYYHARRYDEAIEQCRKVIELNPDYPLARLFMGRAYAEKGMHEEAIVELKKAIRAGGVDGRPKSYLGYAYALAGMRTDALSALKELDGLSERSHSRAVIHTGLGDKEQAFVWLERAYQEHDPKLICIKVDPVWDPLRSDPRFQDLLKRMNLAD